MSKHETKTEPKPAIPMNAPHYSAAPVIPPDGGGLAKQLAEANERIARLEQALPSAEFMAAANNRIYRLEFAVRAINANLKACGGGEGLIALEDTPA